MRIDEITKADLKYSIYREVKPGAMHDSGIPMGVEPAKHLFMKGVPGEHIDTIMQKLHDKLPDQNFIADLEIGEDISKMSMGDTIKDFYKSDAPQFKGKSKKKRRQMAIAAKLSANESLTEAERVFVIVRKKDDALLQKFDSKREAEKELDASAGYSAKTHMIKAMLDPQQKKAEADPTHIPARK